MTRYVASEVLRELVSALSSRGTSLEGLRIVKTEPVRDRWPISILITFASPDWTKPRTFEFFIGSDLLSFWESDDSPVTPAAEAADWLATLTIADMDEWMTLGDDCAPFVREIVT